jgi:hypothetical protein
VSEGTYGWRAGADGLRASSLLVSFQRYVRPASGVVTRAPGSLGALPVAAAASEFLLPLADGEAFWIGVMSPALDLKAVRLEAVLSDRRQSLELRRTAPDLAVAAGVERPDGSFDVLDRSVLAVAVDGALVRVVDPPTYQTLSGETPPGPLDPSGGFGGWQLP